MPASSSPLRTDLKLSMPFSNVLHLPFPEKLRATRLAGFSQLALQPQEVQRICAAGTPLKMIRQMAADEGIAISRLDPLCTWNPHWHPDNMNEAFVADHSISAEVFFKLCETLGCSHMSLNATFAHTRYSLAEQVEHYAQICSRAAEHGLVCDLEPIPMWGVRSLEQGWEIIKQAGSPNGGLVLDTLHFMRSNSSVRALAKIPGAMIHCVQLCDGIHPLPADVSLEQDCFNRLWPGEGNFPLAQIIAQLDTMGALNEVGPEVFSANNSALCAEQVASACCASLARYPAFG